MHISRLEYLCDFLVLFSVPEYEYVQFSLRITEDIIRNDLYSPEEMQRVFSSHVEANRGRLSVVSKIVSVVNMYIFL